MFSSHLTKSAAKYTILTAIDKIVPIIFLPLAVAKLSPESLGLISLFVATNFLFSTFAPLQVFGAVSTRFYNLIAEDLNRYIGNSILLILLSELAFLLVVSPVWPHLSAAYNLPTSWLFLLALSSLGSGLFQTFQTINRLADRWILFGGVQVAKSLLEIFSTLALVFFVSQPDHLSRVVPITLVNGVFGLGSLLVLVFSRSISFSVDKQYLKEMAKFCLPLIPHSLGGWVINSSDRFFLSRYQGIEVTGRYEVIYTLGMMISLLSQAFNMAWSPYLFRHLSENKDSVLEGTEKIRSLYILIISIAGVVLAIGAHVALLFFAPPKYQVSGSVIYLISGAYLSQAFYFLYVNYLLYFHRTVALFKITTCSAVVSVSLSFSLIPRFGIDGAAISTFVSFFLLFIFTKVAVNSLAKEKSHA